MRFLAPLILIGAILASQVVLAKPASPFNDVFDTETDEAAALLITMGAIDSKSSFFPTRKVNRAEFVKIVSRASGQTGIQARDCFPDVKSHHWFSSYVCAFEEMRLVRGYPDGFFRPERTVNYAEALKVLVTLFGHGPCASPGDSPWYGQCVRIAVQQGFDLGLPASAELSRGDVARLVARFVRAAQYSSSVSSSRSSSSRSSSSSLSSSRSSSSVSGNVDPISDVSIRSQIILLGEVSPVLGAVSIFMTEEPMNVTKLSVSLTAEVPTVQSILLYDEEKRFLGRANLDPSAATNRKYTLTLAPGALRIGQRETFKVYARAHLLTRDMGGQGNQTVQVSDFAIEGTGEWSSAKYIKASTETFQPFVTARSVITKVTNPLGASAALVLGTNQRIGAFAFEGKKSDSTAKIEITTLTFHISATGGAAVTNVKLGADNTTDRHDCTVSGTTITCTGIPAPLGSLTDSPRTLTLYGDVTTTDGQHASLQIVLNETGTATIAGSVTWTDGTTSFTWVPVEGPVSNGTRFFY